MSKPKLLDIIREKSTKHCSDILAKNSVDAGSIIDEAKKSSEDMRRQALLNVQSESERLRERKHNTIRFRINARRYELKAKALESIWREAGDVIRKIERSGDYDEILEKLFFECLDEVPDGSEVRCAHDDAQIIKACIERSGRTLFFEEDSTIRGGVEFYWPDGKIVLKNTLSHRLSKLKAEGNAELSAILFLSGENMTE